MAIYKFITDSETKDFNDTERSFVAWASKSSIDRQEDEIEPSGWLLKNYRKNPVVPLFHDYMRFPIAKSLWEKVSPKDSPVGLLFKPQFAETDIGQEAYYLYKEGFMSAFSVGFDPLEWIDRDGRSYAKDIDGEFGIWQKDYIQKKNKKPRCRYTKQELLEISGVLVPAHPEALIEARGIVKTKELSEYLDSLIITSKEDLSEKDKWLDEIDYQKPYPNEHACRLASPEGADRCFRNHVNDPDSKKPFDQIICYYNEKSKVQALRYKKDVWTVSEARSHCKKHDPISFEPAANSSAIEDIESKIMNLEEKIEGLKYIQYVGYYEQEDDDIEIETPEEGLDGDLEIDLEPIEVEL